jgi:hypothetical protein
LTTPFSYGTVHLNIVARRRDNGQRRVNHNQESCPPALETITVPQGTGERCKAMTRAGGDRDAVVDRNLPRRQWITKLV